MAPYSSAFGTSKIWETLILLSDRQETTTTVILWQIPNQLHVRYLHEVAIENIFAHS